MTDTFGFPHAETPSALPLQHSWGNNDLESELRDLFVEVFRDQLGKDTFDALALGAPHLGSLDLVRKMLGHDGLVLLRGERDEDAARYLYRAWRSEDVQGRGLHFLQAYLRVLFPGGAAEVKQLWHDKRHPYGSALVVNEPRPWLHHYLSEPGRKLDGSWLLGEPLVAPTETPALRYPPQEHLWLTSRLQIRISLEAASASPYTIQGRSVLGSIIEILRTVVPARLVPGFLFWLRFVIDARPKVDYQCRVKQDILLRYVQCGRVITDHEDRIWSLGVDGGVVKLPLPFGTFRLGERRGGVSVWRLKSCRIASNNTLRTHADSVIYRTPMVGEPWRQLNGLWALGRRQSEAFSRETLRVSADVDSRPRITTKLVDNVRLDYPFTPSRIDKHRSVDGLWRVRETSPVRLGRPLFGRRLDGFRLGRTSSVLCDTDTTLKQNTPLYVASRVLKPGRRLDGWPIGPFRPFEFQLSSRATYLADSRVGVSAKNRVKQDVFLRYPGYPSPQKLGALGALDGTWSIRQGEHLGVMRRGARLGGFVLKKPAPQVLGKSLALNSQWSLSGRERLGSPMTRRLVLDGRPLAAARLPGAGWRSTTRMKFDVHVPISAH